MSRRFIIDTDRNNTSSPKLWNLVSENIDVEATV